MVWTSLARCLLFLMQFFPQSWGFRRAGFVCPAPGQRAQTCTADRLWGKRHSPDPPCVPSRGSVYFLGLLQQRATDWGQKCILSTFWRQVQNRGVGWPSLPLEALGDHPSCLLVASGGTRWSPASDAEAASLLPLPLSSHGVLPLCVLPVSQFPFSCKVLD